MRYIDLAVVESIFKFRDIIAEEYVLLPFLLCSPPDSVRFKRYPYITHIINNAGVASFTHIDWVLCIKQILKSPIEAVTSPVFNLQSVGERSVDNLGWVWQCNVFGHYALVRFRFSLSWFTF